MNHLSFIIPSYNSEKFLDICINSFQSESVFDKLEIIIVNDGSSDKTQEIAMGFCEKFPNTVRLISQENKGHGGALNTGCMAATGKFLKVVDADDWIEKSNLPEFIRCLESCESDVVLTHHYTINISNGEKKKWMCYPKEFAKEYGFDEIVGNFALFERSLTFHGITYKTDFYHRYSYLLLEHVFYEDHEFSTFPCCFAKSITPFDIYIYCYRIGDVSQSVSQENQLKRISHSEAVLKRLSESYVLHFQNLEEYSREFICKKIKILLLSYLSTVLLVNRNKKQGRVQAGEMVQYFKKSIPRVYEITSKKYKILKLLNYLRISKDSFDKLISLSIYRKMSGKKDFE